MAHEKVREAQAELARQHDLQKEAIARAEEAEARAEAAEAEAQCERKEKEYQTA